MFESIYDSFVNIWTSLKTFLAVYDVLLIPSINFIATYFLFDLVYAFTTVPKDPYPTISISL